MAVLVVQQEFQDVRVPEWLSDQSSFRRWATSDDFPTRGRYAYLAGEIWADPSMEKAAHNQIKTEIGLAIGNLAKQARLGRYFSDRMLLSNLLAGLSTEPDGMYLSYASLEAGAVALAEGADSLEVTGSPDMVLEVVSPTSVRKDTVVLRELYWKAGVTEYWLAEQGHKSLSLEILNRNGVGFVSAKRDGDWALSDLFGRWFRLSSQPDPAGVPIYSLETRS